MSFGKNIETTQINQFEIDEWKKSVVDSKIQSYYIEETKGSWMGQVEDSFNLVVVTDMPEQTEDALREIGMSYKREFNQDAVICMKVPMAMFAKL